MLRAPALAALSLFALACGSTSAPKPPLTAPAAPATLTATASVTTITLSWAASDTATGYAVLRGTTAGGPYNSVSTPATTSYADSGLTAGTAYYYVVEATNAAGASANSHEASATTAAAPPAAPTNLSASGGKGKVTLTWTVSAGATSYKISGGLAAGTHAALGTSTAASYVDLTAPAGVTSHYVVVASNAAGDSPASVEALAITAPPPPTGLHASGLSQIGLTVSWTAAPGAATYAVARGTTAGGEAPPGAQSAALSQVDTGLSPGTTYYYVVTATNASGTSDPSAEFTALTVPANPANLVVVPGNGVVSLSWSPVSSATGYDVLQAAASGGPYNVVTTVTALKQTVTSLTNGMKYYFVIVAHNASGGSGYSNEVFATPVAGLPDAPVLTAATAGNGQVSLTWTSAATSFKVYGSTASANYTYGSPLATPTANAYTDISAVNGIKYYYVIRAHNAVGDSIDSNELFATPSVPLTAPVLSAIALNGGARLSWPAVAGATGYNVYKGNTAGGESATPFAQPVTNAYRDTGLSNGIAVYYIVKATNASATGPQSNEVTVSPVRELCVATDGPSALAFDANASGQTEARRFFGNATRLVGPSAIAVDSVNQEIAALNTLGSGSITVHPTTATGNVLPSRLIAGPNTLFNNPVGVAIDSTSNKLFVANAGPGGVPGSIAVFARTADGDVAPSSRFTVTTDQPTAIAVDSANALLFVAGAYSVQVFHQTDTGSPTPLRRFTVDGAGLTQINALAYDPLNSELYVGVQATTNAILVYSSTAADVGSAHPIPARSTFGATSAFSVNSLLYDPLSSEIVRSGGGVLYAYPRSSNGVITPSRTITTQGYPGAIAFDSAGRYWFADGFSGNQYSTALLGYVPHDGNGAVSIAGSIGARIALNNNVPAWLVADPARDDLWMNSLSNGNFVGAFSLTASVIYDGVPLRQFGGNDPSADYSAIALNPGNSEVYVVSTSNLTVTAFSSTAVSDPAGSHVLGTIGPLPAGDIPNNAVWDSMNNELVISLNNNGIAFYPRTGPGTWGPRRLTIAGPSTSLSQPNALAVDGTSVYAVNRNGTIVRLDRVSGPSNRYPLATLTQQVSSLNLNGVGGILLDNNNLYVANSRNNTRFQISVYTTASFAGSTLVAPARAIEVRGVGPAAQGLAFCN